jgi:hypothetical protein
MQARLFYRFTYIGHHNEEKENRRQMLENPICDPANLHEPFLMIQNSSTHFYRRSYITGDSFPISDITLNNRLIYFQHLSIVIKGLSANFVIFAEISPYGAYEAGVNMVLFQRSEN